MKGPTLYRWLPLTEDASVIWLKYSFGPGTANSLAAKLDDGTWMIVSPPARAPAEVFDRIADTGGVSALIAPNPYHNLGQIDWRTRFPAAIGYAPSGARPRLSKKTPGEVYQPLEQMQAALLPIHLVLPDGMKVPDALFRIPNAVGDIWWMGDLFANSSKADQTWPLRLLARLAGSGLGYRANTKPEVVYVKDRGVWLDSLRRALDAAPPAIVVPAHGDPVVENAAQRTQQACNAIDTRRSR